MMIKHYFTVAIRNLVKYKTQSFISIIGLAVGFTCFALSALWIHYETTYDNFHEGADRLYFAGSGSSFSDGDGFSYFTSDLLADYLMKNYPEIEKASKMYCGINEDQIQYKERNYQMRQIMVDSSFISMFNIKALDGDNNLQLDENQMAITDKAAKRIFGEESPIGKQVILPAWNNAEKTIVAVVKTWEGHSMFSFDVLLPYISREPSWFRKQCYTLFRTYPNCDIEKLKEKLINLEIKGEEHSSYPISTPVSLLSNLRKEHPGVEVNVRLNHIRLFAYIGGLVIICGLCNYLTMLITRIRMRKRELALRKVNGATGASLLFLLLSELFLLLVISLGVGVTLIELLLPMFKRLSNINEGTPFFYKEIFAYMSFLIVVTIGISTLIIHLVSRQTLVDSINSKSPLYFSSWFYKGSILCQLVIGIGFVFCTVVMMKQLNFLLNSRELGLEKHNVGVIGTYGTKDIPLENILAQIPDVIETLYGFCTPIPKSTFRSATIENWEGKADGAESVTLEQELLDQDYAKFFHLEVLEGQMLNENGKGTALINEAALKALGWSHPLGKKIFLSEEYTIIGVIKDVYYNAPSFPVKPVLYTLPREQDKLYVNNDILFKVKEGTWKSVTQRLQEDVNKLNPNVNLRICNIEEEYDKYMKSEITLSKLLSIVSLVCISIAIFGIFSLVTLSCEQRRKEIAVRKVNGASAGIILSSFLKEYLFLLIISSFIAFPLGYTVMKYWLEGYMKQTTVNFWIYGGIFIIIVLIVFLSVIWRVWRAARENPAEVIKSE